MIEDAAQRLKVPLQNVRFEGAVFLDGLGFRGLRMAKPLKTCWPSSGPGIGFR